MVLRNSMRHLLFVLILSYILSLTTGNQTVSYQELQQLYTTCPPHDRCSGRKAVDDTLNVHLCECGLHCVKYRTCCVDSPHKDLQDDSRRNERLSCYGKINLFEPYSMVTTCDPRWRGDSSIKSLCDSESNSLRDPGLLSPATSNRSGLVYKNYHCAMCNDDIEDLKIWNVRFTKMNRFVLKSKSDSGEIDEEKRENPLKEMVYNEDRNQWGLFSGKDDNRFNPLRIHFEPPSGLEELSRFCLPELISDCDVNWTNETVRNKCHAYMAAVYATVQKEPNAHRQRHRYRNIHCAICNFAAADDAKCGTHTRRRRRSYVVVGPFSFTLLLDVNLKDGTSVTIWCCSGSPRSCRLPISFASIIDANPRDGKVVGCVRRCKEGETYDPFFKKCRTHVCALPGYKMVDGKCRKE